MTLEQLMQEHDQFDMLMERLESSCTRPCVDPQTIIAERSELRAVLDHHLYHEDEYVLSGLMRAGVREAQEAARFKQRFARWRGDWSEYLDDWNAECIVADWDEFCRQTRNMITGIRERTQREGDVIYPLALKAGVIALRM